MLGENRAGGTAMKLISILASVGVGMQTIALLTIGILYYCVNGGFIEYRSRIVQLFVYIALTFMLLGWVMIAKIFRFLRPKSEEKWITRPVGWGKHVRDFVCCLACPFVVLFCGWEFFRYFILEWAIKNKDALSVIGVGKIISATAWPALIFILVFLFRKQLLLSLAQVPGLIKRSRYDNSAITEPPVITQCKEKAPLLEETESGGLDNMDMGCRAGNFGRKVLDKIDNEFWPYKVIRESCIDNSQFRFDAAINRDGWIYGVEIKYAKNAVALKRAMQYVANRVDVLYAAFLEHAKNKFVLLLCVCFEGSDKNILNEITQLFNGKPYRTEIRLYDENGSVKDTRKI